MGELPEMGHPEFEKDRSGRVRYRIAQAVLVLCGVFLYAVFVKLFYWIDGWFAVGILVTVSVLAAAAFWAMEVIQHHKG